MTGPTQVVLFKTISNLLPSKVRRMALANSNGSDSQRAVRPLQKCLFGVPDSEDIENLLELQKVEERERIFERFGFDIRDIEQMENRKLSATTSAKKRKYAEIQRPVPSGHRRRRLFAPCNVIEVSTTQQPPNQCKDKETPSPAGEVGQDS